jgi:hypothetical protein
MAEMVRAKRIEIYGTPKTDLTHQGCSKVIPTNRALFWETSAAFSESVAKLEPDKLGRLGKL